MRDIEIPEEGLEGIRCLLNLGENGIARFCRAIEATGPTLLSPGSRAILLEEEMGESHVANIEKIIAYALHPLFLLRQAWEVSPQEVHASVARSLKRAGATWDQADTDRWLQLEGPLISLLNCGVAQVEAKAESLLRQRANRVQSTRLFTDSRPVFDDERRSIAAVLLIDTLRVRFQDGDESRVMHFALDESNLDELEKQIVCAKRKRAEMRNLNQTLKIPVLCHTSEATGTDESEQEQ